ncbi:MAG TPA: Smr/MutS family protein [Phototrophicaceae bacterium]|nr:Smr/MutS family protein [Phototrophicaceae bacterium]
MSDKLDLHAYPLGEALETFLDEYNRRVRAGKLHRFTVIHGYGSTGRGGKIRQALRLLLAQYPECVSFSDTLDGNDGATIIHPKRLLPTFAEYKSAEILAYCRQPRPISKIHHEFAVYGAKPITKAVDLLVRQKKLVVVLKREIKCYQTVAALP